MLEAASALFGHSELKSLTFLSLPSRALPLCRKSPLRWEFASGPTEKASDGFFKNPLATPSKIWSQADNFAPLRALEILPTVLALIHWQHEWLTPQARAKAIWKSYQPRYLQLWSKRPHWHRWLWPAAGQSLTNSSWQRPKLCPKPRTILPLSYLYI